MTFIATVEAVIAVGATPVLVDVDPDSWNLNAPSRFITPEDMNEIKNKETK
jgi:dTDP-4-amino-4,6-dideoxygalactose transaminase